MKGAQLLFVVLALFALPLHGNPTFCEHPNAPTRTIEIVYSNPGQAVPCEVLYARGDETDAQSLWRAQNQAGYCEEKAREFVNKLQNELGWTCRDAFGTAGEEPAETQ